MVRRFDFCDEFRALSDAALVNNSFYTPFYCHQWHEAYFQTLGSTNEPILLSVNNGVTSVFEKEKNEIRFGGGIDVSDYMDILGPESQKHSAWADILKYLIQHFRPETIFLPNVPHDSQTYQVFSQSTLPEGLNISIEQEDVTPVLYLPESEKDYLDSLSKTNRHELQRKIRKFNRDYSDIQIRTSSDYKNIGMLLSLMSLNPKKESFLSDKMQNFFRRIFRIGRMRPVFSTLSVGNDAASVLASFHTDEEWFLYNSGFDEKRFSGSGFYLKARDIFSAIHHGVKKYNFLQGNERYKYALGGQDKPVYGITLLMNY